MKKELKTALIIFVIFCLIVAYGKYMSNAGASMVKETIISKYNSGTPAEEIIQNIIDSETSEK